MDTKLVTDLDWAWLAGLFDGEGCFTITFEKRPPPAYHVRAAVGLRADDWKTLELAQRIAGVGLLRFRRHIKTEDRPNQNHAIKWEIGRIDDCLALAAGFNSVGGLRSKKNRDFLIWQEAASLLDRYGGGVHSPVAGRLAELKGEMHAIKPFNEEMASEASTFIGLRTLNRGGRGSATFWQGAHPAALRERQSRQIRYAKLSQPNIDDIVAQVRAGKRRAEIAAEYNISVGLISRFLAGKYLRRDGSLTLVENEPALKPTDPAFWQTEAGQRAHRQQALARGKITQVQIDELVARYKAGGVTMKALAEEYGVSRPLIGKFISGDYIRRD